MTTIFISYRRDDASDPASSLHEDLASHFGARNVFWDHDSLKAGVRYDSVIAEALNTCKVVIAVIGRDWTTITEKKRLTPDKKDYARWEISTALKRTAPEAHSPVIVIPVLVGGAQLPTDEDLPVDLKALLGSHAYELRAIKWKEDLAALVRVVEENLETDNRYSILGGAIAGLVTGTIVGVLYYLANRNNPVPKDRVEWTRIIWGGLFGILAGVIFSLCINKGVALFSKWLNYAPYSKIIGGIFGGIAGGIITSVLAGFGFAWLSGNSAEPLHIALAVAFSIMCIVLGTLWPDLKSDWWEKCATTIILACVTFTLVIVTRWVVENRLDLKDMLNEGTPLSEGVLLMGAICGIMAGMQAGMALFLYDRIRRP